MLLEILFKTQLRAMTTVYGYIKFSQPLFVLSSLTKTLKPSQK